MAATASSKPASGALERLFATIGQLVPRTRDATSSTTPFVAPANPLLDAENLGALESALDAMIDDRTIFADVAPKLATTAADVATARDSLMKLITDARAGLPAVIGPLPTKAFIEGIAGLMAVLSFFQVVAAALPANRPSPPLPPSSESSLRTDRDLLEFLYSTDLPLVLRESAWHLLRGIGAMGGIGRALARGRPLEEWRASALASTFRDGVALFVTGLTQSISAQELPFAFRRETLDDWLRHARQQDAAVYFPLGDGDAG